MARGRGRGVDYEWLGNMAFGGSVASDASFVFNLATATQPVTIFRLRGRIRGSLDGPVDGDKTVLGCGIINVTEEQVAAGSGSIPSPIDDPEEEWIWMGSLLLMAQEVVTQSDGAFSDVLEIDSKAMRKQKVSQSLVIVVRNKDVSGAANADVIGAVRCLAGS